MKNDSFIKIENVFLSKESIDNLLMLQSDIAHSARDPLYNNYGAKLYQENIDEISDFIMELFDTQDTEGKDQLAMSTLIKLRDLKHLIRSFMAPDLKEVNPEHD